jgi:hypothetical protein
MALKKPLEKDIQRACLEYLQIMYGADRVWRNASGAMPCVRHGVTRFFKFGRKGAADISGIVPPTGRRLEVEVKREGQQLRPEQEIFLGMIREAGGIGICVHSVDELIAHGL